MITRVREGDGGYVVTISSVGGVVDTRVTPDLAEAFALQRSAQETGAFPVIPAPTLEVAPVLVVKPKAKRGH